MTVVPDVPVLRTGHFALESGPADFAIEHLTAAVEALNNDPAVLPMRVRIELQDPSGGDGQGHDLDAIGAEAGGALVNPCVGWGDNYRVAGNTMFADLHVPAVVAEGMEWAWPSRSIEGVHNWTTATGHTHDFVATGLLLLGPSWPGVTTLPDWSEVQSEFAADVAAGTIDAPSYAVAQAEPVLARAAVCARVAVAGRAPGPARANLRAAGLNVGDLMGRWYAAEGADELAGLPDSYSYWAWYCTEVRALDDGTLAVFVLDEDTGQEWQFAVTSVTGGQVTFAEPVEVVRPDPIPVAAAGARPRPALARFNSRAESRAASSPSHIPTQEDDQPMNDALRRLLAERHGLDAETATADEVTAAEIAAANPTTPIPEGGEPEGEGAPENAPEAEPVAARTTTISRDVLDTLQRDAAEGVAARAEQIAGQRTTLVTAAVADGRITPAEAGLTRAADGSWPDGWRRDMDDAPEVTARALARLEAGKYPGATGAKAVTATGGRPNSLNRALAAAGITPRNGKDGAS